MDIKNTGNLPTPTLSIQHILLADDDKDDQYLFNHAVESLHIPFALTIVQNGEELMQLLNSKTGQLPDILFLDLNMPRKNGYECLLDIKSNEKLKHLPVIISYTSRDEESVSLLHENGAHFYIQKPDHLPDFKKLIYEALALTAQDHSIQPPVKEFVLTIASLTLMK